ncbi:MAG: redoxin domain-containing protein [Theionarchaea archaeon]|nr:redoxin domain-containing protein [Theionarchaea archaeon]MBU7038074.1 redoxin domain-containing protein [Theionarchaea archaeon]
MEEKMPLIGDTFPQVEVATTRGRKTLPDAYSGRWEVFFSHPADFIPVYTAEFVAFQKKCNQFNPLNRGFIGLRVNQVFSHLRWVGWINQMKKLP